MNSQEFLTKENQMLRARVQQLEKQLLVLDRIITAMDKYRDMDEFITVAVLYKNNTKHGEIDLKNNHVHVFVRDNEESVYNNHIRYTSLLEAYQFLFKDYNIQFII
jgi:hypothetical protein